MVDTIKHFFAQAAIIGGINVLTGAPSLAADDPSTVPKTKITSPMTASAAKALIQRSNRLMDDMAIMGIIGAFNTNTDVKIDSGTYAIGLSKEKCEKLKADNLFAIDLDTYQQAQKVLVSSGQLTTEQAGRDFRTQVAFLKIAESRASAIASTCNELGVHNVFPTLTPKVTP